VVVDEIVSTILNPASRLFQAETNPVVTITYPEISGK